MDKPRRSHRAAVRCGPFARSRLFSVKNNSVLARLSFAVCRLGLEMANNKNFKFASWISLSQLDNAANCNIKHNNRNKIFVALFFFSEYDFTFYFINY